MYDPVIDESLMHENTMNLLTKPAHENWTVREPERKF